MGAGSTPGWRPRPRAGSLLSPAVCARTWQPCAVLSLPWSTSPVEGQINRLKTIKRQMYGRAGFDLLRRRILAAA
jgi:hypothetical protein